MAFLKEAGDSSAQQTADILPSSYSPRPAHGNSAPPISDRELTARLRGAIAELRRLPDVRDQCCGEKMLRHIQDLELMARIMKETSDCCSRDHTHLRR
jgi:hypothetical protein